MAVRSVRVLNGESAEVPSKDPKTGVYDVYTRSFS